MINVAFNLAIYTVIFFLIGMYKPKWPLFFLKKPDRFLILAITTVLFMVCATLYGEGNRQNKVEQDAKIQEESKALAPTPAAVSAPLPAAAPTK